LRRHRYMPDIKCNYHFHCFMMPTGMPWMDPMAVMGDTWMAGMHMPGMHMPGMHMPGMMPYPMPGDMFSSHLGGNPDGAAGVAGIGGPFFRRRFFFPFFFPFFPFFPFLFFPFI